MPVLSKWGRAAVVYLNDGLSVFPLVPNRRTPMVEWSEFMTTRASVEDANDWWTGEPSANVGMACGRVSGLVVLDIDPRHGGEVQTWLDEAPTNMVARTPRGGWHLFYKYPKHAKHVVNRTGIRPGVDVKADHGFVVMAPSKTEHGQYEWESKGEPGQFPQSLLVEVVDDGIGRKRQKHASEDAWITDLLANGAPDGQWNDSVARLAGYYAGKGVPVDIATGAIVAWNHSCNKPPHTDGVLARTVESVYKTADRRTQVTVDLDGNERPAADRPVFDVWDLNRYMVTHGGAEVTWMVEDWLPKDTIGFIVSPPGSFKTWLLMDLAVSVAGGTPFLGQFKTKQGPVLLIQQEDHHGGLAERLAVVLSHKYGIDPAGGYEEQDSFQVACPPSLPIYIHPDRALRFDNDEVMDELERVVARIKPAVVLIDPLYSATSADDYMANAAEQMFRLKHLRDRYGCTFVVTHHTKKSAKDDTARQGLWGSQFLNAFLETGWQIRRNDGDHFVTVRRHFKVTEDKPEVTLTFDISTHRPYRYEVIIGTDVPTMGEGGKDQAGVDLVALVQENGPLTAKQMCGLSGKNRSTVSRRLKALERDAMLVKSDGDKWSLVERPEF